MEHPVGDYLRDANAQARAWKVLPERLSVFARPEVLSAALVAKGDHFAGVPDRAAPATTRRHGCAPHLAADALLRGPQRSSLGKPCRQLSRQAGVAAGSRWLARMEAPPFGNRRSTHLATL